VRVYRIALLNADIDRHLKMGGLAWPIHQKYVTAHYTMDNYKYNPNGRLTDTGILGLTGEIHGQPQFVKVSYLMSSCLHFTSGQIFSVEHQINFSGKHSAMLLLLHNYYLSCAYPVLPVTRYS